MSHRRPLAFALLARFALGAVAALVVLELLLRQVFFLPPGWDPVLGRIPQPGSTVRIATEGFGTSRWTIHGVRRATPPDPRSPAVLVLGDSFTEALGVDDADVFTQYAEAILGRQGIPLQILNVGRSGASVADYVASAATYRQLFEPVWTVIALRANDLGSDAWSAAKTRFIRNEAGLGVEAAEPPTRLGPREAAVDAVRRHSTLVNFGIVRLMLFREAGRREPPLFRAASTDAGAPQAFSEDAPYPVEEELAFLAAAYSGRVTLVYLPTYGPPRLTPGDAVVDARMRELCAERRWSCVSLADTFPQFEASRASPYGFPNSAWNVGHLNASGHHAIGELLARELMRLRGNGLL